MFAALLPLSLVSLAIALLSSLSRDTSTLKNTWLLLFGAAARSLPSSPTERSVSLCSCGVWVLAGEIGGRQKTIAGVCARTPAAYPLASLSLAADATDDAEGKGWALAC